MIYLLLAASAVCYGPYWWIVPAILAARAACISFLDYVYHYGTRTDELMHASNLRLPAPIALLLLNFNLHGVHHRLPYLPWHALPAAFRDDGDRYDGGYLAAAARQLRGPIPRGALESTIDDRRALSRA
jgi:fatty acid desaturase